MNRFSGVDDKFMDRYQAELISVAVQEAIGTYTTRFGWDFEDIAWIRTMRYFENLTPDGSIEYQPISGDYAQLVSFRCPVFVKIGNDSRPEISFITDEKFRVLVRNCKPGTAYKTAKELGILPSRREPASWIKRQNSYNNPLAFEKAEEEYRGQ